MRQRHLLAQRMTDPIASRVAESLYLKELAIISLITEGYRNKQIGARLNVGEGTVKNYCRNIYNATGMGSRVELAVFALQHPELIAASHEAIAAVSRNSSPQPEEHPAQELQP